MASVNVSVRQAIDSIATPSAIKRRLRLQRRGTLDRIRLAGIAATKWLSKATASRQERRISARMDLGQDAPPYIRFRRIARAVALLTKVCKICKRIVYESVSSEEWFKMVGKFVEGDEKLFDNNPTNRPRPFVTFVPGENKGRLVQLTFDKSEFSRESHSDHLLNNEIRGILKTDPDNRTISQEHEVVWFLKRLSTDFNGYPLEMQRRLAKCLVYDRYYPSRVLTRQGMTAETVYFVLAGTLVEKTEDKRSLKELKPGDRFGERDIVCGSTRTSTVVTKTLVEVLSVHRQDYRAIFNMADDSNNPRYLDICRHDIVFQHFPLRRLRENPSTWAVLSYKFGRLMVKDSNDMEWIYIVKSGEARIIKHLETKVSDPESRKRRQREKLRHDQNAINNQLIDFMSDKRYMASHYKSNSYTPRAGAKTIDRSRLKSAPAGRSRVPNQTRFNTQFMEINHNINATGVKRQVRPHSQPMGCLKPYKERIYVDHAGMLDRRRTEPITDEMKLQPMGCDIQIEIISPSSSSNCDDDTDSSRQELSIVDDETKVAEPDASEPILEIKTPQAKVGKRATFLQTGTTVKLPHVDKGDNRTAKDAGKRMRVPPFVMLECLHAGQVFGLRSCLEPEERGPSVSLVSGGCEVLQISKKFFLKHIDEAILGLIKVKYRAFPSEEDMMEQLDATLEWQEFKHCTVLEFLKLRKGKDVADYCQQATIC